MTPFKQLPEKNLLPVYKTMQKVDLLLTVLTLVGVPPPEYACIQPNIADPFGSPHMFLVYFYFHIYMYPPPPVSKNHLAQEPTPGSAVKFSHHFFYQGSGFFMFLVDVGQLFRCAGHHFMCVTTGPPIRGDPISHSQAHMPLKPLPPALDPFPEATSP